MVERKSLLNQKNKVSPSYFAFMKKIIAQKNQHKKIHLRGIYLKSW